MATVNYLQLIDGTARADGTATKSLVTSRSLNYEEDVYVVGDVTPSVPAGTLHNLTTGDPRRFVLQVIDVGEPVMLVQGPANVTYLVPQDGTLADYRIDIRGVFFDPENDEFEVEAVAQTGAPLLIGIDSNREFLTVTPTQTTSSLNTITLNARQGGSIRASTSFAFNVVAFARTIAVKPSFIGSTTGTRLSIADNSTYTFNLSDYFDTRNGTARIRSVVPASGTSGLDWTAGQVTFTAMNLAGSSSTDFTVTITAELAEDTSKTATATVYVTYAAGVWPSNVDNQWDTARSLCFVSGELMYLSRGGNNTNYLFAISASTGTQSSTAGSGQRIPATGYVLTTGFTQGVASDGTYLFIASAAQSATDESAVWSVSSRTLTSNAAAVWTTQTSRIISSTFGRTNRYLYARLGQSLTIERRQLTYNPWSWGARASQTLSGIDTRDVSICCDSEGFYVVGKPSSDTSKVQVWAHRFNADGSIGAAASPVDIPIPVLSGNAFGTPRPIDCDIVGDHLVILWRGFTRGNASRYLSRHSIPTPPARQLNVRATFAGSTTGTRLAVADNVTREVDISDFFTTVSGTAEIASITPASGTSGVSWTAGDTKFRLANPVGGTQSDFTVTINARLKEDTSVTATATLYVRYSAPVPSIAAKSTFAGSTTATRILVPDNAQNQFYPLTQFFDTVSGTPQVSSATISDSSLSNLLEAFAGNPSFRLYNPVGGPGVDFSVTVTARLSTRLALTASTTVYFRLVAATNYLRARTLTATPSTQGGGNPLLGLGTQASPFTLNRYFHAGFQIWSDGYRSVSPSALFETSEGGVSITAIDNGSTRLNVVSGNTQGTIFAGGLSLRVLNGRLGFGAHAGTNVATAGSFQVFVSAGTLTASHTFYCRRTTQS